jgi:hypothetical protein
MSKVLVMNPQRIADLVVTTLSLSLASVARAGSVTVKDGTLNNGTGSTVVAISTEYRLSTQATITSADLLLGNRAVGILAAGASSTGTVLLTIPLTVARGNYFLGACADSANVTP